MNRRDFIVSSLPAIPAQADRSPFSLFLTPVRHAGAYNTISCAAGHHLAEGLWLRGNNGKPQPHFRQFSRWFPAALLDRFLVNADRLP